MPNTSARSLKLVTPSSTITLAFGNDFKKFSILFQQTEFIISANGEKELGFSGFPQITLLDTHNFVGIGRSFSQDWNGLPLVTHALNLLSFLKVVLFLWMKKEELRISLWISEKEFSLWKERISQSSARLGPQVCLDCFVFNENDREWRRQ